MDKHPDKYFSNKLSNYRKEPPSGAWERIDANLGHSKPRFAWMKLAASVLILVVAGIVFFMINTKPVEVYVNQPELKTSINPTVDSIIHQPEVIEQSEVKKTEGFQVADNTKNFIHKSNPKQQKHFQEAKIIEQPLFQHTDVVEAEAQPKPEVDTKEYGETIAEQKLPSRVITYSAHEVNKKYLRIKKKEAIVYSEPAKEKHTIGEIASVIKHNSVGIGDLRQIKDDFLSLELFAQNDKTKTQ